MSDRSRRIVCRITFVVFCLFPTLIVVNWALFPRTAAEWQAALQPQLGLLLRFDRVATRTPFKTVFRQVQVADPQRLLLARIPQITWSHEPAAHVIELTAFEISRDELTRGCRQLLAAAWSVRAPLRLSVPSIRIADSDSAQTLTLSNCSIQLHPAADGFAVELSASVDPSVQETLQWKFQTQRGAAGETQRWELQTGANFLPAWLLASEIPQLGSCGTTARFRGHVVASCERGQWIHTVRQLTVEQFDLQSGFANQFGYQLTGLAQIDIPAAQLIDGRLQSLTGRVTSPTGQMSRELLRSLSKWLRWQIAEPTEPTFDYSNLALGLELHDRQVALRHLDGASALLWDSAGQQPIAAAGDESKGLPVHVLGCCLAHESAYALPADAAILSLMQHLPLQ